MGQNIVLFSLSLGILVIFHDIGWLETKDIIKNLVKLHHSGWFIKHILNWSVVCLNEIDFLRFHIQWNYFTSYDRRFLIEGLKKWPWADKCLQTKPLGFRKMNLSSSYKLCFSSWKKILQGTIQKLLMENMQNWLPSKTDLFLFMKVHFLFHFTDYSFKSPLERYNSFEITLPSSFILLLP